MNQSQRQAGSALPCGEDALRELTYLIVEAVRISDDAQVKRLDLVLREVEELVAMTQAPCRCGAAAAPPQG